MFHRDTAALVIEAAKTADLPADVLLAITEQESGGNPWAWRPEPPFVWYWDFRAGAPFRKVTAAEVASEAPPEDFTAPPGVARSAEWWGQSVSWGLMQVMGSVARECGFRGPYLTELCDPAAGLKYGAEKFRRCMVRYGKLPDALAAYNAGSVRYVPGTRTYVNQGYVDAVLFFQKEWQAWLRDVWGGGG